MPKHSFRANMNFPIAEKDVTENPEMSPRRHVPKVVRSVEESVSGRRKHYTVKGMYDAVPGTVRPRVNGAFVEPDNFTVELDGKKLIVSFVDGPDSGDTLDVAVS